jgi:hypothetical protein
MWRVDFPVDLAHSTRHFFLEQAGLLAPPGFKLPSPFLQEWYFPFKPLRGYSGGSAAEFHSASLFLFHLMSLQKSNGYYLYQNEAHVKMYFKTETK